MSSLKCDFMAQLYLEFDRNCLNGMFRGWRVLADIRTRSNGAYSPLSKLFMSHKYYIYKNVFESHLREGVAKGFQIDDC